MHEHSLAMPERYQAFCDKKPNKIFLSSQNVALIQYRLPAAGEGFRVRVNFKDDPQRKSITALLVSILYNVRVLTFSLKNTLPVSHLQYPHCRLEDGIAAHMKQ